MGRELQQKAITLNGNEFTVQPLSATEALKVSVPLFKLIGAPAGALFGSVDISKAKGKDKTEALTGALSAAAGGAMAAFADRLTEDGVLDLVKRLLVGCTVELSDGEGGRVKKLIADVFDTVFQGDLVSMFKVVGLAIEVNYLGPFGDWRALLKLAMIDGGAVGEGEGKAEA